MHTGPHYDLPTSQVFFEELGIRRPGTHAERSAAIMVGIEKNPEFWAKRVAVAEMPAEGTGVKQVLIRHGQVAVEEVPAPAAEPGTVLVQVDHSCISVGTEMSGVRNAATPLWKRAIKRPQAVMKAVKMVSTQGLAHTRRVIDGALSAAQPAGYSAAGTILEVGDGIGDLQAGDRVACAGAGCANHAEFICPPRNLVTPIPDGLDFAAASTVTLGAIAMQGVRRASPTLGETFVVIGLGLLGQLACQLLKANGCRVIGTDLDSERIALAESLGIDVGVLPDGQSQIDDVVRLTDGIGADGVIITAATPSDEVVSTAFGMCRKKGRVVLVGDVGLKLNRADFYAKELDFFISTSYGPGRYDRRYEEQGLDYPVSYVRWTENRNMSEYLRLVAEGKIQLAALIGATYPIEDATKAYSSLDTSDGRRPLMVLLSYPRQPQPNAGRTRIVSNPTSAEGREGRVRIALIGAGGFAKGMHLPNLRTLKETYEIRAIASRTGHNAASVARQFGARYSTTDYRAVLDDAEVDAVLITTRHNQHASVALEALQAGKHVLVEKPLALQRDELDALVEFYESHDANVAKENLPVLLTGFNRRFSPHARKLQELTSRRTNPMILNYRMNAGYIPLGTWYHEVEGGGRNLGEACHIYDLFVFLTGSRAVAVDARAIQPATGHYSRFDNFVATITFADGSVATLTYTAMGTPNFPKESLEIFVDGRVIALNDYKTTTLYGARAQGLAGKIIAKGHREELEEFARVIQNGGDWPNPLWQQVEATEIAFRVEQQITGMPAETGRVDSCAA